MEKEHILLNHENKEICKRCGGRCCKNCGCELFPEDLKEITKEILIKKIKQGFCFDCWDGNPTEDKKYDNNIAYYMRARNKDAKDKIVDFSWGGECIFLTPTGCKLIEQERPSGGKALIPDKNRCFRIKGYSKQDCAIVWLQYNELIEEVIAELKNKQSEVN